MFIHYYPIGNFFNRLEDYCVLPLLAKLIYVYIYL